MPIPDLTFLQFLILDILGAKEKSGMEIREELKQQKVERTRAAFYQLMSRLEDVKFVKVSVKHEEVGGQRVSLNYYKLTGEGAKAYNNYIKAHQALPSGKFALQDLVWG